MDTSRTLVPITASTSAQVKLLLSITLALNQSYLLVPSAPSLILGQSSFHLELFLHPIHRGPIYLQLSVSSIAQLSLLPIAGIEC